MIRHAGLGQPQSVGTLAHSVHSSASVRPLIAAIGRTELFLPNFPAARLAAIALSTVAMDTDAEGGPAGTTVAHSENDLGHDYPSSPITLHQMTDDVRLRRR
jgi:hypothetical protein